MAVLLSVTLGALRSCRQDSTANPPGPSRPADLLVEFDGIQIRLADIEPLMPYFDMVDKRLGRQTRIRTILKRHLIPLKLAERDLATARAEMAQRAEAMVRVIGNGGFPELLIKGKPYRAHHPEKPWLHHELPMPVAAFAFDHKNLGQVSPAIAVPQGFAVVSACEIITDQTQAQQCADACLVTFYTHDAAGFDAWWKQAIAEASRKLTYVNPDYRDAMPEYFQP